jgi:hypothetical protein
VSFDPPFESFSSKKPLKARRSLMRSVAMMGIPPIISLEHSNISVVAYDFNGEWTCLHDRPAEKIAACARRRSARGLTGPRRVFYDKAGRLGLIPAARPKRKARSLARFGREVPRPGRSTLRGDSLGMRKWDCLPLSGIPTSF